jgi:hypothetical protein
MGRRAPGQRSTMQSGILFYSIAAVSYGASNADPDVARTLPAAAAPLPSSPVVKAEILESGVNVNQLKKGPCPGMIRALWLTAGGGAPPLGTGQGQPGPPTGRSLSLRLVPLALSGWITSYNSPSAGSGSAEGHDRQRRNGNRR